MTYIIYAVLGLGLWMIYGNTKRKHPLPPGPKGYPLVGNALQLDGKRPWHTLAEFKEKYGEIVHLRLFSQDVVVLNSAKAAGDLLDRRAAIYSDRPRTPVVDYITGGLNVIFLNLGPLWRSMRRAAHVALNMRAISRYQSIQMHQGIRFAEDMLQSPDKHLEHTQNFAAFEITSLLYNDSSLGQQIEELSKFIHILEHSLSLGTYLVNYFAILEYVPEFLAKWKRDSRKVYEAYSKKFLDYFLPIKESVLQKNESGPSFCATLVETQEQHGLSDLESAWLSATLYMAGYDTTSATLGWLVLAMVAYPDVQLKAQEELDRVIGRARVPMLNDMEHLPYLRAVVKEVRIFMCQLIRDLLMFSVQGTSMASPISTGSVPYFTGGKTIDATSPTGIADLSGRMMYTEAISFRKELLS
ncbi:hypothetical protein VNI00_009195 [Paramarasmius palmivorus]|uniref:Cytochrome P450 n=1 Tax=Paramarasmius palmivorus TaxID=297713 RepID=A0AAW0CU14_9AGAR